VKEKSDLSSGLTNIVTQEQFNQNLDNTKMPELNDAYFKNNSASFDLRLDQI